MPLGLIPIYGGCFAPESVAGFHRNYWLLWTGISGCFAPEYAYIKSEFLMPKKLTFYPTNIYFEALKNVIANHEKEELKHHD